MLRVHFEKISFLEFLINRSRNLCCCCKSLCCVLSLKSLVSSVSSSGERGLKLLVAVLFLSGILFADCCQIPFLLLFPDVRPFMVLQKLAF